MRKLGVSGFAPSVEIKPYNPELKKYQRAWDEIPAYRVVSPGETLATRFLHQAQPPKNADAIDFGCGTGRGGLMLALMGGMRVTMVDFAGNCLDPEVVEICKTQPDRLKFMQHDLTQLLALTFFGGTGIDYVFSLTPDGGGVYLAGTTFAADFPGTASGARPSLATAPDGFVIRLSTDLGTLCDIVQRHLGTALGEQVRHGVDERIADGFASMAQCAC